MGERAMSSVAETGTGPDIASKRKPSRAARTVSGFRAGRHALWFAALLATTPGLVRFGEWSFAHMTAALQVSDEDRAQMIEAALRDAATPDYLNRELAAAFARGDYDDARVLLQTAERVGAAVDPTWRARYEAATTGIAGALRDVGDCGGAFVTGATGDDALSLACAIVSDFTVVGDVRDAGTELTKIARGEPHSDLILGLAAAGLALEGALLVSGGAAAAPKVGVSAFKTAARSGKVTPKLARELRVVVGEAVDLTALRSLRAADLTDGARLGRIVDKAALTRLVDSADGLRAIRAEAGTGAAMRALRQAESLDDIRDASRIAKRFGAKSESIFRVLGEGALRMMRITVRWTVNAFGLLLSVLGAFFGFCYVVSGAARRFTELMIFAVERLVYR